MSGKLVIIPTYNERENIAAIIKVVMELEGGFNLLIVDDGSPDGTANIVKELQTSYVKRLFMIERSGKLGLGTAYIAGFRWALENGFDYVFEMDADFSHNPNDLIKMAAQLETQAGGVVIGSRYVNGVNVVNWPIMRIIMSYYASAYVRFMTRMPVRDATAGFVGYSAELLRTINLDGIRMKGYGFQIEMKYTAWKLGFKITEIPIIFTDRTLGTSKMSSGIFGEAFWGVIKLRFRKFSKK